MDQSIPCVACWTICPYHSGSPGFGLRQSINLHSALSLDYYCLSDYFIHVIFSWAQIGRSAIFGREIGVPDREIFSRQKKSGLMSKIVYLH